MDKSIKPGTPNVTFTPASLAMQSPHPTGHPVTGEGTPAPSPSYAELTALLCAAYRVMDEVRTACIERDNGLKYQAHYGTWAMELADAQRDIKKALHL